VFGTITNYGSTLIFTPCVRMYVYTITQVIIADLSVSDISNCCVCPLIQTVNSNKPSQPLHPPFSLHKIKSNKPSQPLRPPPYLTKLVPTNPQSKYNDRFCTHTFYSNKPLQPLHPPICLQTFKSSKLS